MNEAIVPEQDAQRPSVYRSYLLRLWCTDQCEVKCWRASLQDPRTDERIGFASLEELFAFLMQQVEAPDRAPHGRK